MSFSLSFSQRMAALRQAIFDLRDDRNPLKERVAFARHRLRTCLTGHITPIAADIAFSTIIDFVDERDDLREDLIDEAMIAGYQDYKAMGAERSGLLPDFLWAQFEHYLLCYPCRDMVYRRILADWESAKTTRALIACAREEDPEGFERLRQRTANKYLTFH